MGGTHLLSQRKYAESRGLTHQAVNKAVKSGRIALVDGLIDPVAADAAWGRNTRPRSDVAPDPGTEKSRTASALDPGDVQDEMRLDRPQATYTAARALREVFLAKQAKLDYERSEEKLIPVEEIRTQAFEAARGIRDQLLALPARLAPVVFAAPDVAECHRLLEEAMREVCADFSPGALGAPRSAKKRRSRASR